MSLPWSCLYLGRVTHRRFAPRRHGLSYRVYNLFADVDELPELAKRCRLFSHNRFNLVSFHDRDHGDGSDTPLRQQLGSLARGVSGGGEARRFFVFCYPRVLGYVFNPLTVYYGYREDGTLALTIYEVSNTFGGRMSYVIPATASLRQACAKALSVSPFNGAEGEYRFHFALPGERFTLGILLSENGQPVLKALVTGERRRFSDATLLATFLAVPFLTLKVIAAIHWQALKLWMKGLQLQPRRDTVAPPVRFGTGQEAE